MVGVSVLPSSEGCVVGADDRLNSDCLPGGVCDCVHYGRVDVLVIEPLRECPGVVAKDDVVAEDTKNDSFADHNLCDFASLADSLLDSCPLWPEIIGSEAGFVVCGVAVGLIRFRSSISVLVMLVAFGIAGLILVAISRGTCTGLGIFTSVGGTFALGEYDGGAFFLFDPVHALLRFPGAGFPLLL